MRSAMQFMKDNDRWFGVRPWSRHSLVLMVAGLVYTFIGIAYMVAVVEPERLISIRAGLRVMPLDGWGALFVLVGLGSMISAKWPPAAETWGYMALTGLSSAWASVYGLSILLEDAPPSGFTSTALWFLMAFLWWGISGLMNPERVVLPDG